jgi:cold shock CspA family protein
MSLVFISYRREETSGHAGRLYDRLEAQFGEQEVFMDLALEPGLDFVEQINEAVGSCRALIAVIGPEWATVTDEEGQPRLMNPDDLVRLEVEAALGRADVRVIPALVRGARMPRREALPDPLHALLRRNAIELSDERWAHDVGRLVSTLEKAVRADSIPSSVETPAAPPTVAKPEAKQSPGQATGIVHTYVQGESPWGFIRPDDDGVLLFLHHSEIAEGDRPSVVRGAKVSYEVEETQIGLRAVHVKLIR